MSPLTATCVWRVSAALVVALDERLGTPVDSYVNGSQVWLANASDDLTLEWRLHPVAAYEPPRGLSHYDLWEQVAGQLATGVDPDALALGTEGRALTGLWDGLECFAAYDAEIEPAPLAALATATLGIEPDASGLVDHARIGDAWERSDRRVSIVGLLLEELEGA